jgi:hypothetical protein
MKSQNPGKAVAQKTINKNGSAKKVLKANHNQGITMVALMFIY